VLDGTIETAGHRAPERSPDVRLRFQALSYVVLRILQIEQEAAEETEKSLPRRNFIDLLRPGPYELDPAT